ncbi:MAG: hypothetical protein ACYCUG_01720 [Acidimicrobiales bacterium]
MEPARLTGSGSRRGAGPDVPAGVRRGAGHLGAVDVVRFVTVAGVIVVHITSLTAPGSSLAAGRLRRGAPYVAEHFLLDLADGGAHFHLYFLLLTFQLYLVFPPLVRWLATRRRTHGPLLVASLAFQLLFTAATFAQYALGLWLVDRVGAGSRRFLERSADGSFGVYLAHPLLVGATLDLAAARGLPAAVGHLPGGLVEALVVLLFAPAVYAVTFWGMDVLRRTPASLLLTGRRGARPAPAPLATPAPSPPVA